MLFLIPYSLLDELEKQKKQNNFINCFKGVQMDFIITV